MVQLTCVLTLYYFFFYFGRFYYKLTKLIILLLFWWTFNSKNDKKLLQYNIVFGWCCCGINKYFIYSKRLKIREARCCSYCCFYFVLLIFLRFKKLNKKIIMWPSVSFSFWTDLNRLEVRFDVETLKGPFLKSFFKICVHQIPHFFFYLC